MLTKTAQVKSIDGTLSMGVASEIFEPEVGHADPPVSSRWWRFVASHNFLPLLSTKQNLSGGATASDTASAATMDSSMPFKTEMDTEGHRKLLAQTIVDVMFLYTPSAAQVCVLDGAALSFS